MIDEVLVFLKNRLNNHLRPDEALEDQVVFLDGQNMEPLSFKLGAVTVLMINVEEENTLRPADPYLRTASDGTKQRINPDIRLTLFVLFAARYKRYEDSLFYLSKIIQYFQSHRVINHENAPELSAKIEKLTLELVTLPFSEQNEIWNSLRITYHPSVLYRVRMIVFRDEEATTPDQVKEVSAKIREKEPKQGKK